MTHVCVHKRTNGRTSNWNLERVVRTERENNDINFTLCKIITGAKKKAPERQIFVFNKVSNLEINVVCIVMISQLFIYICMLVDIFLM